MVSNSRTGEGSVASTMVDRRGGKGGNRNRGGYDDAATEDLPLADTGAAWAEPTPPPPRNIADELDKSRVKSALFHKPRHSVRISRFVLLQRIAHGGMGNVFAAYDAKLDRKVAIKLVRPEFASTHDNVRERLLREAQALARVSHPNVVQVYEAGEAGDEVYVAMELVPGTPLHIWLALHAPDRDRHWRTIVDKFIAAGRGLAAVHAADLLHRDFKPANVLVRDDGRVCVVDFGLARAASDMPEPATIPEAPARDSQLSEQLTQTGTLLGTPAYMAPEQITGGAVDHRSDQFSFCVALYEALYGFRPFPGEDIKTLRSSVTSGEILAPPAQSRVPVWIWRVLVRGLATHPDQRYPGMTELLAALERVAVRKRRRWVAAAALLCGGMLAGGAAVLGTVDDVACADAARQALASAFDAHTRQRVQAAFASTGVPYADTVFAGVARGISGYIARWQDQREAACRAAHVDEIQTHHELALRNRCLDDQAQRLQRLIDRLAHADARLVEKAHDVLATMDEPETCSDVAALRSVPPPDLAVYSDVQAIYAALDLARVHAIEGRFEEALRIAGEQIAAASATGYAPAHARALYHAGDIHLARRSGDDAQTGLARLHDALDLADAAGDDALATDIWNTLVHRRDGVEDPAQVAFWARRALALTERTRDQGVRRARALHNLGTALYRQQQDHDAAATRQRQAIELARDASAPPLLVAEMLHDRANTLQQLARHADARTAYEEALAITRAAVGDAHPQMMALRLDYADFLIQTAEVAGGAEQGDAMARARAYLEEERARRAQHYGAESLAVAKVYLMMGIHDLQRQAFDSAEEHLRRVVALHESARGRSHPDLAEPLMWLGMVCFYTERHDEALGHWQRERDLRLAHAEAQPETIGVTEANIGEVLVRLGRHDEALEAFDRAQRRFDTVASVHPAYLALVSKGRGQALLALGRPLLAVDHLERALQLARAHSLDRLELADTLWSLARALRASQPRASERARALAAEARGIYESGDGMRARAAEIAAWLRH